MRFIDKIKLLQRVDLFIRMKSTGTSSEFATKLGISRSTVYEVIEIMRSLGADIEYCQYKGSFYYTSDKELALGFVDPRKVRGGKKIRKNLHCPAFSDNYSFTLLTDQAINPQLY